MTADLVFLGNDGEPFTTSLVIAAETGNEHASVARLVRENLDDLADVGLVRFEIRPRPEGQHGGGDIQYAVLDEPASALLMTYLRNSPVVKDFKKRLVAGFYALRKLLVERANEVKPLTGLEYARRLVDAEERAEAERERADKAERRVEVEQRHRRAIEGGDGIDPTTFGKKYFSDVPARKFDDHLYKHGYLINQRNTRVRADGEIRDGYDHRKPTAKGRRYFYPHDNGNHGGRRRFTPRIRPQMEIELRDALAAEGLPVNTHSTGLVLITSDELKALGG